ncbi:MAG: EamA family transporter [Gammaproteobacteria bacterium]|nr:EamA family transporter [Gammaproteobacteria bacterium]
MRTIARSISARPALASIAVLLVAMVSIQVGAALAKTLLPAVGAAGAAALRLAFASLLLLGSSRPWRSPPNRHALPAIIGYGFSMGGMNLLFYSALQRIPLGIAVALEFTGPFAVAVSATRRGVDFFWCACAVAGLWLLLPLHARIGALDPVGIGYALAAGGCWALYILFGRRAGQLHRGGVAFFGMLAGSVLVVPIGIDTAGMSLWAPALWPAAVGVAILSSALPYSLEMYVLTRLPARTFGVLMSAEPAVAALSGFCFLGERLSPLQWFAILCIMVASGGSAATSAGTATGGAAPVSG